MTTLISILTIFTLLFGGAGTAYASQDSLPNDTLYPVKLWTEDLRLQLASSSETEMNLLLEYAQRRVDEISALVAEGEVPPEETMERLQNEIHEALQLANSMEETARVQALIQAKNALEIQSQQLEAAQEQASGAMEQARAKAQEAVEMGIQQAENSIATAQSVQEQMQNQAQEMHNATPEPPFETPVFTETPGSGTPSMNGNNGNGGEGGGEGNGSGSFMPTPGSFMPTQPPMGGDH